MGQSPVFQDSMIVSQPDSIYMIGVQLKVMRTDERLPLEHAHNCSLIGNNVDAVATWPDVLYS